MKKKLIVRSNREYDYFGNVLEYEYKYSKSTRTRVQVQVHEYDYSISGGHNKSFQPIVPHVTCSVWDVYCQDSQKSFICLQIGAVICAVLTGDAVATGKVKRMLV